MLRFLMRSRWVERASRGVPVLKLVVAAEVALLVRHHLLRLDPNQRRRLFQLLVSSRGRPAALSSRERNEVMLLIARLEPRLFLGTAVGRFSPVPLPKRMLYGPRGSTARAALARKN